MARLKKLTDATYSPTIAASEEAIRTQIDDSIQEVLDLALEDVTTNRKLSATGDFTGTINGGDVTLTEPGLSGAFNAHLADNASLYVNVKYPHWSALSPAHSIEEVGYETFDSYAVIQAIIDYCSLHGIGEVYLPKGTYLVGTSLSIPSNVKLVGAGKVLTTIREHADLGANPIILAVGTSGNRLKNVKLNSLTIRNGTASEGSFTVAKDGVKVEYCDGFYLEDCKVTEIQGAFGVKVKYSTNIFAFRNEFYRCTNSHFYVLPECEYIHVEKNTFDTSTSLTTPQNYLFATGGEALGEGSYYLKNLWVKDNKFLNNPRWEAIDCHGGENVWIEDNFALNCKMGVMVTPVSGYVNNPVVKHVTVRGNTLIQGTGQDGEKGIVVGGKYTPATKELIMAEHIVIEDNKVVGFGGTADSNTGTVQTYWAKDVTIEDNEISEYAQYGINLYGTVWGAKLRGNKIKNCRGGFSTAITSAICVNRVGGNYDIWVDDNTIDADDETKRPAYGISDENILMSVQIGKNSIHNVATGLYRIVSHLPVEQSVIPTTNLTQKYGDVIYTDTGKPGWYVSAPKIGFGSLYTNSIVTVDIESGSKVATIKLDVNGAYWALPEGMNVSIAGAGVAGVALTARIIRNDGTNITLDTAASTTVVGANLTYQSLTLTA
jgi:hypothetical protein